MDEKLIKITARMIDGTQKKHRVTSFEVKPFRNAEGLYVKLDNNYTFACKSIQVEQKEIEQAFCL